MRLRAIMLGEALLFLLVLTAAGAAGAKEILGGVPAGAAPAATVDLTTDEGLKAVGGVWRYSDKRIVETELRAPGPDGQPPNPTILTSRSDLQARVDWANDNHGDLFLSLHSNDAGDISESGVEVWYCADREDGAANEVLAQMLLGNVLDGLRAYGYRANNRGIKEDRYFRVRNGRNFHLFVLGPRNPDANHPRATVMPAALIENLFMRHARDQYVLRDPAAREAITQSMRQALNQFFEWRGG